MRFSGNRPWSLDHLINPAQFEVLPGGKEHRRRGRGDTHQVAAAIQNHIEALVETAHGAWKTSRSCPRKPMGRCDALPCAGGFATFKQRESGEFAPFLDNVDIRSREETHRAHDRTDDGLLEVHLDVYGYAQTQQRCRR